LKLNMEGGIHSLAFFQVTCNGYEMKDLKDRVEFLQNDGKKCGIKELLLKFDDLKSKVNIAKLFLCKN